MAAAMAGETRRNRGSAGRGGRTARYQPERRNTAWMVSGPAREVTGSQVRPSADHMTPVAGRGVFSATSAGCRTPSIGAPSGSVVSVMP